MIAATASPVVQLVGQAAVDAAATFDDEVAVLDGIDEQQAYANRSITIGGTWDPDTESLTTNETVTLTREQVGGGRRVRETTTVSCIAFAGSGDRDLPGHRAAVAEILTALQSALRALTELPDHTPVSAQLTDQRWAQVLDAQGGGAMCLFTVTVVALP